MMRVDLGDVFWTDKKGLLPGKPRTKKSGLPLDRAGHLYGYIEKGGLDCYYTG